MLRQLRSLPLALPIGLAALGGALGYHLLPAESGPFTASLAVEWHEPLPREERDGLARTALPGEAGISWHDGGRRATVSITATDPSEAGDLAKAAAATLASATSGDDDGWHQASISTLVAEIAAGEAELAGLREAYGIDSDEALERDGQERSELLAAHRRAEAADDGARATVEQLEAAAAVGDGTEPDAALPSGLANLHGDHQNALAERATLAETYGQRHPRMIAAQASVADTRARLAEEIESALENARADALATGERLRQVETRLARLEAEGRPAEVLARLRQVQQTINVKQAVLSRLESEPASAGSAGAQIGSSEIRQQPTATIHRLRNAFAGSLAGLLAGAIFVSARRARVAASRTFPRMAASPPLSETTPPARPHFARFLPMIGEDGEPAGSDSYDASVAAIAAHVVETALAAPDLVRPLRIAVVAGSAKAGATTLCGSLARWFETAGFTATLITPDTPPDLDADIAIIDAGTLPSEGDAGIRSDITVLLSRAETAAGDSRSCFAVAAVCAVGRPRRAPSIEAGIDHGERLAA